jgi:hypothetical protein
LTDGVAAFELTDTTAGVFRVVVAVADVKRGANDDAAADTSAEVEDDICVDGYILC